MQTSSTDFLPRIQGLRALAVLSVVAFHIWPTALPGGYVGVDVFFVISGYLITGALQRELSKTGSISLSSFYLRRIRRLLPAATATLLGVSLAMPLLPGTRWRSTAIEVLASAMYAQNWWLTFKRFDYLTSDVLPGPVVHFWSLSIEEQWYIVLPPTLLLAALVSRRAKVAPGAATRPVLLVLVAGSFLCSALLTESKPAWAYFATATRIWELGLGGLLAVSEPNFKAFSARFASPLAFAGLLAIAIAMFTFDATTAFPGVLAAVPTLGAALVVLSARYPSGRWSPLAWLETAPALFVGDISYSLYLWHWPLIVFAGRVVWDERHQPSLLEGLVLALVAVAVAALSKRFVEDQFRYQITARPRLTFALGAASMLLFGVFAWQVRTWETRMSRDGLSAQASLMARALAADLDLPEVYQKACHHSPDDTVLTPCHYGPSSADRHIVIAGDSHAASWIPALAELAKRGGIRLTTYTKSACPIADLTVQRLGAPYPACTVWREALFDKLASDPPSLVLFSESRDYQPTVLQGTESATLSLQRGLASTYRRLVEAGVPVAFIADVPQTERNMNECLSSLGATLDSCSVQEVSLPDPIMLAKAELGGRVIQLSDQLCSKGRCRAADGSVLVWRDTHHITATYARTFADRLEREIAPLLADSASARARL